MKKKVVKISLKKEDRGLLNSAVLLALIAFVSFFALRYSAITGLVTGEMPYTENLSLSFNESTEYDLKLRGNPLSLRLSGYIIGEGKFSIYVRQDDKKYLVLDSASLEKEGIPLITGYAVENLSGVINNENLVENITEKITIWENITIENITATENINKEINITENITDIIEGITPENLTIKDLWTNLTENITEINITPEINITENITTEIINKTITNKLAYKKGTKWDADDNGIERIDWVVDFTVEKSEFNWEVDREKLCTRWEVASLDNDTVTTVCHGSADCCSLMELVPSMEKWDEPFNLYYGEYGATFNNKISARVIYANYSLAVENPYTEILYSSWKNLNAKFIEKYIPVIKFNNICVETCSLIDFDKNITLIIELNNITINLTEVTYDTKLTENITTNITENITEIIEQMPAEINKPVKWVKRVRFEDETTNAVVRVPKKAESISIRKTDKIVKDVKIMEESAWQIEAEFKEILIEEPVEEIEVEYYTPGATVAEENVSAYSKRVVVSSDIHYTNVLTYTHLPSEVNAGAVRLYWILNGSRILVENVSYFDLNNNSLIDYIQWITPYLSNQTFELELVILNVQSYPALYGNWTVAFETVGVANLTIKAFLPTTWSNKNEENDLRFLEIRCGNNILPYQWNNNSVFISDYSCNETGHHTVKVLTTGEHTQQFTFGGITKYAYNELIFPSWSNNQTTEEFIFNRSVQLNVTLSDDTALSSVLFSWNGTVDGSWYNYSNLTLEGTSWVVSTNVSLGNLTPFGTVAWTFYFNDTSNNKNQTSIFTKQLVDLYPGWNGNNTNASLAGPNGNITFNITLTDEFNLSSFVFSWNGTSDGSWLNYSNASISGMDSFLIINKSILTGGSVIAWTFYFNDSGNNKNQTSIFTKQLFSQEISSCQDLPIANTYYALDSNANSSWTCFNVLADNITLDCRGYLINYSQSVVAGYGVNITNKNFTTVKSCYIAQGSETIWGAHGIYATKARGTKADNNTITLIHSNSTAEANAGFGIYFLTNIYNASIYNNSISTAGNYSYGIYLSSTVANNSIYSNVINTSGSNSGYGIYLKTTAYNNPVYSNTIKTNGSAGYGIHLLTTAYNNSVYSNTINTSGTSGIGIYLFTTTYNNSVYNNTIKTSGSSGAGIYLSSAYNNPVYNNTIKTSGSSSVGIYLYSAYKNLVYSNIINTSGSNAYAITLYSTAYNNLVYSNTINASGSSTEGIRLTTTVYNNSIYSNTISTTNICIASYSTAYNNSIYSNTISANANFANVIVISGGSNKDNLVYLNTINVSGSSTTGITISESSKSSIYSNTIIATSDGISVGASSYNNSIYSNVINTTGTNNDGIKVGSYNNSIYSNSINTNGTTAHGINFASGENPKIYSNIINTTGSSSFGIYLFNTNNSLMYNIYNNSIITKSSTTAYGIYLSKSNNNSFLNNTIKSSSTRVYLNSSANNKFENDTFIEGETTTNFDIYSSENVTANFTNVNFNKSDVGWMGINNITVKYYLNVSVQGETGGAFANAGVNISDYFNTTVFSGNTSDTGDIIAQTPIEFTAVGSYSYTDGCISGTNITCFTPYTATAYHSTMSTSNITNLSSNKNMTLTLNDAPAFSNNQTNATGDSTEVSVAFNITMTDEFNLSYWIFSWNGTGGNWDNLTNGSLEGISAVVIANKSINLSVDNVIGYRWYSNDSVGNWNYSWLSTIVIGATDTYPGWSSNQTAEEFIFNRSVQLNVSLSDTSGLSSVLFSWNGTDGGFWYNYSNLSISGASWNVSINKSLGNLSPLTTVYWTFYFNDSINQKNQTAIFSKQLLSLYPGWNGNETNGSLAGINGNITLNVTLTDEFNLSSFVFSWNNTGSWVNDSNASFYGGAVKLIINKSISLAQGNVVGWTLYFNDSNNNKNQTSTFTFMVANTPPTTPITTYPENAGNYSDISINFSASDADNDSLTYYILINNLLNITTDLNITDWNASDGYYNITIHVDDSLENSSNSSVIYFRLDTTPPSWSSNQTNASGAKKNDNVTFNITVSDYGSRLSYFIFSWNGTGNWDNLTNGTLGGSQQNLSVNRSVGLIRNNTIGYLWYANDTAGNWNLSELRTFAVANYIPSIAISYPPDNDTNRVNISAQFIMTDKDLDNVSCSLYINRTINATNSSVNSGILTTLQSINLTVDGDYLWHINCSDLYGYSASSARKYTLDTVNPIITFNYPASGNATEDTNVEGFNLDVITTDSNLYRANLSVLNENNVLIYNNYSENISTVHYNFTGHVNWSNQSYQLFRVIVTAADDHTGTSSISNLNKTVVSNTTLVFNESENEMLEIKAWFVNASNDLTATPADFMSYIRAVSNEYKFGFNYTATETNMSLVLNLTSPTAIYYRAPLSGITGHIVWGDYYTDFQDAANGSTINVTQINATKYQVKISSNPSANAFVQVDPAVGGLNIVERHVRIRKKEISAGETAGATPTAAVRGGVATELVSNFVVDATVIRAILKQGKGETRYITVTNTGDYKLEINIDAQNLDRLAALSHDSVTLSPGESTQVAVDLYAPDEQLPDVYTGRIVFKSGDITRIVNVIIEVKEKIALFDIKVELAEEYEEVYPGSNITADIFLYNLGELKPVDVIVYYSIKNMDGTNIIVEHETLAIEEQKQITRSLKVPEDLEPEKYYLFYGKVIYKGVGASSSAVFKVKEMIVEKPFDFSEIFRRIIIIASIIVLISTISYVILMGHIIISHGKVRVEIPPPPRINPEKIVKAERVIVRDIKKAEEVVAKDVKKIEEVVVKDIKKTEGAIVKDIKKLEQGIAGRFIKPVEQKPEVRKPEVIQKIKPITKKLTKEGIEKKRLLQKIKEWKKLGYDTALLEGELKGPITAEKGKTGRNELIEKVKEWKKKGYDTTPLELELGLIDEKEFKRKLREKLEKWKKKGYDVRLLEKEFGK